MKILTKHTWAELAQTTGSKTEIAFATSTNTRWAGKALWRQLSCRSCSHCLYQKLRIKKKRIQDHKSMFIDRDATDCISNQIYEQTRTETLHNRLKEEEERRNRNLEANRTMSRTKKRKNWKRRWHAKVINSKIQFYRMNFLQSKEQTFILYVNGVTRR